MVKPIICFLHRRGISSKAYIKYYTNKTNYKCWAIFQIHVIVLVFMCCGWSINWVKTNLDINSSWFSVKYQEKDNCLT